MHWVKYHEKKNLIKERIITEVNQVLQTLQWL